MTFCLLHLSSAICLYQICATAAALILGSHAAVPWLYASALLSSLFNEIICRRCITNPQKRFSRRIPLAACSTVCFCSYGLEFDIIRSFSLSSLIFLYGFLFAIVTLMCLTFTTDNDPATRLHKLLTGEVYTMAALCALTIWIFPYALPLLTPA